MRTKVWIMLVCLQAMVFAGMAANKVIKGNGNVVTREIAVTDFDEIDVVGNFDFEYEPGVASPYLTITLDENLFEHLNARVEGRTLKVYLERDAYRKGHTTVREDRDLRATTFKVRAGSSRLEEASSVGAGSFIIRKPMHVDHLELNKAGSGAMRLEGQVTGRKLELDMAGSGKLEASDLRMERVECSVAGSGKIRLKGTVKDADYSVAGSGKLEGFACEANRADCSAAGSGSIEVYATEHLDASIAGSGKIRYQGDPELSKSIVGSGSVKKAD